MRAYSMSYRDTLALPIRTFWALAMNVNRLRAEEDRRMFQMLGAMWEGGKEYVEQLDKERGLVAVGAGDDGSDDTFDRAGVDRLKALMSKPSIA